MEVSVFAGIIVYLCLTYAVIAYVFSGESKSKVGESSRPDSTDSKKSKSSKKKRD